MNKNLRTAGAALIAQTAIALPLVAHAVTNPLQSANTTLGTVGTNAGVTGGGTLPQLIGTLINTGIGVVGIFLVVWIVYAGYIYMMSQGEAPKVDKAKKMLSTAIIGLVIMLMAYAISTYVLSALLTATGG